jgi:hypothetical protein
VLLGVLSSFNLGHFHGEWGIVHPHEQFHSYLGSAYLKELRYDGIYAATALAMEERSGQRFALEVRHPVSFRLEPFERAVAQGLVVKERFTPQRWAQFKTDLEVLARSGLHPIAVLQDHGNTGSPSWAVAASAFSLVLGIGPSARNLYALLDPLLLALVSLVVALCCGPVPAGVFAVGICTAPLAYDYVGGSLLRLDWLAALGLASCALRARWLGLAGALLAWAVLSRPHVAVPVAFLLAWGVLGLLDPNTRPSSNAWLRRLALGGGTTALVLVAASCALFGPSIWLHYLERVWATAGQSYYPGERALRDVVVRCLHAPEWLAVVLATVLSAAALWRCRKWSAPGVLGLGCLLVVAWVPTNSYYWQMLGVVALCFVDVSEDTPLRHCPGSMVLVGASALAALSVTNLRLESLGLWSTAILTALLLGLVSMGKAGCNRDEGSARSS